MVEGVNYICHRTGELAKFRTHVAQIKHRKLVMRLISLDIDGFGAKVTPKQRDPKSFAKTVIKHT